MLAPLAMMAEAASWPAGSDGSPAQQLTSAAAAPGVYTAAWTLESLGAALSLIAVVALMGRLRGRGRVLALIGGVLAVAGQIGTFTGGGFNAAIVPLAQQPERAVAIRALNAFNDQPVLALFAGMIWLGILGTVLLAIGAWRARIIHWWVLALLVVGAVVVSVLDNDRYGLAAAATYLPLAAAQIALGIGLFRSPVETAVADRSVRAEPVAVAS